MSHNVVLDRLNKLTRLLAEIDGVKWKNTPKYKRLSAGWGMITPSYFLYPLPHGNFWYRTPTTQWPILAGCSRT